MPIPHMLALAPLDVWFRTLRGTSVHPRYWIRLLGIAASSLVGTMCSTPERLGLFLYQRIRKTDPERFDHAPGVLIILGYYRSGTTHAHNLIACDPNAVTPRWYQTLMGQGFLISWTITRFLLVPFLGSSRPQDGVGFGPRWPGEDDFALASWGSCSTLPGRLILPSTWDCWKRWNTLETCTEHEHARWRKTLAQFAWKVTRRNTDKLLILKTPSHGAHIDQLLHVFGDRARFIHISRDPHRVIESNMRLHDSLKEHLLEDPLDAESLRARIVEEYHLVESRTDKALKSLDQSRFAQLRHEDLIVDPIGQLSKAYQQLNMPMSQSHTRAIELYLSELGHYTRPEPSRIDLGTPNKNEAARIEQIRSSQPQIENPTPQPIEASETTQSRPPSTVLGVCSAIVITLLWGALWIGLVWIIKQIWPEFRPRIDQFMWIGGSVIALLAVKAAGGGSSTLGWTCAILALLVFIAVSFPITVINWNWGYNGTREQFIHHNMKGAIHGLRAPSSIIYALLGMLTAWRHASDTGPKPPGMRPRR
jgi:omega-hydroxy-beta-dihydromenaquinone-9 sulfotransferase